MPTLESLLKNEETVPLMGERLHSGNTLTLDFSPSNLDLLTLDLSNTEKFNAYVFSKLEEKAKTFGIGGYFEHRAIYSRSAVFVTAEEDFRDIHMGVDIWANAGKPVFAPIAGSIHSFADNAGFGNYGPTIILQHNINGTLFYSLYGHLMVNDLINLKVGQSVKKGEKFCHVGPFPENGDWPPHLHFQLMWDMLGNDGDFPGVCSHREMEKFMDICPDPNLLIRFIE